MIGVAVLALGLTLVFGYLYGEHSATERFQSLYANFSPYQATPDTHYPLVAPLIGIRAPEATQLGEYVDLKNAVTNRIETASSSGMVSRVSYYFRDLNSTEWVGINQNYSYYPASLLKVPVMIAYYKKAEDDPSILSRTIVYQNIAAGDPFDAPSNLLPGNPYTIEELIDAMIVSSDNGAALTLLSYIDQDTLNDVYANLGIQNPGSNSADYQISTRTYGLFFRILYNATYLDAEYSNKALALLERATFAQGLVAGVPTGTEVAHKFGEHVLNQGSVAVGVELHDCGVVYYPQHPYLVCVMTSAQDVATASSVIKDISALTYSAIAEKYPEKTALKK
jgi:beta-lactamase class A